MTNLELQVERIVEATEEVSVGLGQLMPDLSDRFSDNPIGLETISKIIDSENSELFIARLNGEIVGSGVMNLILSSSGSKAWLEDFVVSSDEALRGSGIGYLLWQEFVEWAKEREAPIEFTSSEKRGDAHAFYFRQGAMIKSTSVFKYDTQGQ